jgi:hypothetical protein
MAAGKAGFGAIIRAFGRFVYQNGWPGEIMARIATGAGGRRDGR